MKGTRLELRTQRSIDTGDSVTVEMTRVDDPRVPELRALLEQNTRAKENFERLTPAQRRMFCLEVADAKSTAARERRAARLLQRIPPARPAIRSSRR